MVDSKDLNTRIISYLYLTVSRICGQIPFAGSYWLEEITRGVGQEVLKDYRQELQCDSRRTIDICRAYLQILDREEVLSTGSYRLQQEEEDEVLVTMNEEDCVYRYFCRSAKEEGILFYCPRLGAMQAALKQVLGVEYTTGVEIDMGKNICQIRIYPARERLRTEMIRREHGLLKIAGERAVLFPQEIYASLLEAIKDYAPHIVKNVLFDAGYRSSLTLAEQTKRNCSTPEEVLQDLFGEMLNVGLGRAELISLEPEKGRAVIRCYDSFEVATIKRFHNFYRTPRVLCDLLRGKFSAYLTVVMGRSIICEEMQCESVNGSYCEFHAYPQEGGPPARSESSV